MNAPRPIDRRAVTLVVGILVVIYGVAGILRHDPQYWSSSFLRLILCLYAGLGLYLARRPTWTALRVYSVVLAILFTIATAYLNTVQSDPILAIVRIVLVMFLTLVFLLTPIDVIVVLTVIGSLFGVFWSHLHPPLVASLDAVAVIGAAMAAGVGMAFALNLYRAGLNEGRSWWREACARERALREFAQLAVSSLSDRQLLAECARRIAHACPGGRCAIVLAAEGDVLRVLSAGGVDAETAKVLEAWCPPPSFVSAVASLSRREPLVVREGEGAVADLSDPLPEVFAQSCLVVLPIVVDAEVAGAILLTRADTAVPREDLLLWQAMSNQIGLFLAKTRLLARLQLALSAKSEFVNTMSHELRSPLNVIIGYAEMLEEGETDTRFAAGRVRRSGLELLQLVENTMEVARLDTGRLKLNPEEFRVEELFTELEENIAALPEAQGDVRVRWEVVGEPSPVILDRLKVKEVVQNLVSNGLKYSDSGTVHISACRQGELLRIDVSDQGPGIPLDSRARIFEMFERIEPVQRNQPSGVGLGLYIVKNLVALMQGSLQLTSQEGGGSCFTVYLPRKLAEADAQNGGGNRLAAVVAA